MTLHCFQHVPFEGLGTIADWAARRGYPINFTRFYENAVLPSPEAVDLLVVLGGPMGVYSERDLPWLAAEKRFIEQIIAGNKPVVGICLGAQLVAEVLGGRVYQHTQPEIGWWPLRLTEAGQTHPLTQNTPQAFTPFHWHQDTYDLPHGCVNLATSEACAQQMFMYGDKVLGLQFHAEMTPRSVQEMIKEDAKQWPKGAYVQSSEKISAEHRFFEANQRLLFAWLDRLIE